MPKDIKSNRPLPCLFIGSALQYGQEDSEILGGN